MNTLLKSIAMKILIQQTGDYSLLLKLDPVEVTDGVRLQLVSYLKTAKQPDDSRTQLDLHLSKQEFSVLCRALNIYSMQD